MAVDYTKSTYYKNILNTNKNATANARKSDFETNRTTLLGKEKEVNVAVGTLWGTAFTAIAGGGAFSSAGGALAGSLVGLLTDYYAGSKYNNVDSSENEVESGLSGYGIHANTSARTSEFIRQQGVRYESVENAKDALINRNTAISSLKGMANRTKSQFDQTYGTGMYDKIEESVMYLLDLSNPNALSQIMSGLQTDTIVGQVTSRLVDNEFGEGIFSQSDVDKLLSSNVSLASFGKEYTNYLYEAVMGADGSASSEGADISKAEQNAIEDSNMSSKELFDSLSYQFANAFLEMRNTNISNASAEGNVGASAGNNGMKASKSSRISSIVQRYRSDLSKVSYQAMLKYYQSTLARNIQSLNISRDRVFSSTVAQRQKISAQIRNNIENTYNEYTSNVGQYVNQGAGYQRSEEQNYATALATDESIKEMDAKYGFLEDDYDIKKNISIVTDETK